jgi:hypothetical protein
MENKRCRREYAPLADVVNRNSDSVYQTDVVLILIRPCANRSWREFRITDVMGCGWNHVADEAGDLKAIDACDR